MSKVNFSSKDILLLLLYAPKSKDDTAKEITGRTRIIKLVYLFQKEIYPKFKNDNITLKEAEFKAWNFGPWSKDVYEDIEFLTNAGFIAISKSDEEPSFGEVEESELWENDVAIDEDAVDEFSQETLKLTDLGTNFTEAKKWAVLSDDQKEVLSGFKEKFGGMPLYALLRYVYTKYPDSTVKSKILDKVLG